MSENGEDQSSSDSEEDMKPLSEACFRSEEKNQPSDLQMNDEEAGMSDMFASVWVKVEVQDVEQRNKKSEDEAEESISSRIKKRTKYKACKFICENCNYKTPFKNCLKLHMLSHTAEKPYGCNLCDYVTKYTTALHRHIKLQHRNTDPDKPIECDFCDYVTKTNTALQRHILLQHKDKMKDVEQGLTVYQCEECPYASYYKYNLSAHKRKHLPEPDKDATLPLYYCEECPYASTYKYNLKSHKRKHKSEKDFKCDHCSYTTSYRHNYIKHSKTHTKRIAHKYKCDKCPFVTKFEGHITRHLAKIHNEVSDKANRCDLCDFSTKVRWRLNIHKQRSKQQEIIKCMYCDFETYYRCESKKHKVNHYSEIYVLKTPHSQPQENVPDAMQPEKASSYSTQPQEDYNQFTEVKETNYNTQHLEPDVMNYQGTLQDTDILNQTVHEKTNNYITDQNSEVDWNNIQVLESNNKEKPFQCTMCTYTAKYKACVQRHFQRLHTGSQHRPYKCVNCDFSTKTKDQITLHNKRSQSGIEMFCRTCNFSTFFKCQYVMHQKCHYNHKCSLCDYTCKNKYDITKHYSMVHLGIGMKCRFCDYKAYRLESLQCHETIHTGEKPFKCTYCTYTSVRKSLLVNHIKRYHSDIKLEAVVITDSKIQSLKFECNEQNDVLPDNFCSEANSMNMPG